MHRCVRGLLQVGDCVETLADEKLTNLLSDLTADCPRGKGATIMDRCGARYLDL